MIDYDESFWQWVERHKNCKPDDLRLRYHGKDTGIDTQAAILQIECRQRFGKKLKSTLQRVPRFVFPSVLAGEQSTSDLLADYHATLVIKGGPLVDLTSGLGIDALHCSIVCSRTLAIERSEWLSQCLMHNAKAIGCRNFTTGCGDCESFIVSCPENYRNGTMFIDPARRDDKGDRVYCISDCTPDVTAMLPTLSSLCKRLVIKLSPMLDVTDTIHRTGGCRSIIAVGTKTECKELIVVKDFADESVGSVCEICGIVLSETGLMKFSVNYGEENDTPPPIYSNACAGDYIYEPYPSIAKLNVPKSLASRFSLAAFHPNVNVYHTSSLLTDFPGNIGKIEEIMEYSSRNIKRFARMYPRANVACRNFGIDADELTRKLKIKQGGDIRVIGLSDKDGKRKLIVARMIS